MLLFMLPDISMSILRIKYLSTERDKVRSGEILYIRSPQTVRQHIVYSLRLLSENKDSVYTNKSRPVNSDAR